MPSAKSERAALRKRQSNQPLRTRARTYVRNARRHIADGDMDRAERSVRSAVVALDKATSKGALHPNNAARRKSRLTSQLSKAKRSQGI